MNKYKFKDLSAELSEQFSTLIDENMMSSFLSICGDINPLHSDRSYAQSKGFESEVVFGMLSSTFYSRLVGVHLPGMYAFLQSVQIDFVKPLYTGEEITVYGRIIKLNELFKLVEIKAHILRGTTKISRAKIKVGLLE